MFRFSSLTRGLTRALVAVAVSVATVPSAHAAAVFEQKEVKVTRSDPFLYMPTEEVWDVLPYRDLVVKFKITGVSLDATKYVRVYIQTNSSLEGEDWKDIDFAPFVQGTDSTPTIVYNLININDTVPMGRYIRWRVAFETATSTQYVTFSAVAVGRE
jgi:hypothetical protein